MKCPEEVIKIMHDYLDDDLDERKKARLRQHLHGCKECQAVFKELKKTIAFVKSTSNIQAPENFTDRIMASLPKEKKRIGMQRWLRSHPFVAAVSLFVVLMLGSLLSIWNENKEFSVSKQPNLVIKNDTVIVPRNAVVKGNVVVQNGKLKIEGKVQGNVTVINGQEYMASAGKVTGQNEKVNAVFNWIWYSLKRTSNDIISLDNHSNNNE